MKHTKMMIFSVAITMCLAATVMAQPPGGQRGGQRGGDRGGFGGERGQRGGERGGFGGERGQRGGSGGDMGRMMQMIPVLAALDADKNGVISKSEIKNAAAALRKLDKNGDGELDAEEMRPSRSEGGRSRGGGPEGGPEGERGGRSSGAGGMMDRLMSQDKNEDGKLSKDEVDERMLPLFDRLDANSDGSIDKSEIEAAAARMGGSRGGRGGPGGPGGNQGGGQRPQRPSFDGGN